MKRVHIILLITASLLNSISAHPADDLPKTQIRLKRQSGVIDFSNAVDDPESGLRCVEKEAKVQTKETERVLECVHSIINVCHYTYVTKFNTQREEVCEENYEKVCQVTFKKEATEEEIRKCYRPLNKVCNGQGPEQCRTVYESACTTRYIEKQNGKFVGDTTCEKLPIEICGAGCVTEEGEEECHDKTVTSLIDVPEEVCDLVPQKTCRGSNKLVPYLEPVPQCEDVTREVCSFGVEGTKIGEKPIVTKWCYNPNEEDIPLSEEIVRSSGNTGDAPIVTNIDYFDYDYNTLDYNLEPETTPATTPRSAVRPGSSSFQEVNNGVGDEERFFTEEEREGREGFDQGKTGEDAPDSPNSILASRKGSTRGPRPTRRPFVNGPVAELSPKEQEEIKLDLELLDKLIENYDEQTAGNFEEGEYDYYDDGEYYYDDEVEDQNVNGQFVQSAGNLNNSPQQNRAPSGNSNQGSSTRNNGNRNVNRNPGSSSSRNPGNSEKRPLNVKKLDRSRRPKANPVRQRNRGEEEEGDIKFHRGVPQEIKPVLDVVHPDEKKSLKIGQASGSKSRDEAERKSLAKVIKHKDDEDIAKTVIIKNTPEAFKVFGVKNVPKDFFIQSGQINAKGEPVQGQVEGSRGRTEGAQGQIEEAQVEGQVEGQEEPRLRGQQKNRQEGGQQEIQTIIVNGRGEIISGGERSQQLNVENLESGQDDSEISASEQTASTQSQPPSPSTDVNQQNQQQQQQQAGATTQSLPAQPTGTTNPFLVTTPRSVVVQKGTPSWDKPNVQPVATPVNSRPIGFTSTNSNNGNNFVPSSNSFVPSNGNSFVSNANGNNIVNNNIAGRAPNINTNFVPNGNRFNANGFVSNIQNPQQNGQFNSNVPNTNGFVSNIQNPQQNVQFNSNIPNSNGFVSNIQNPQQNVQGNSNAPNAIFQANRGSKSLNNPVAVGVQNFATPNNPPGPSNFQKFQNLQSTGLRNTIKTVQSIFPNSNRQPNNLVGNSVVSNGNSNGFVGNNNFNPVGGNGNANGFSNNNNFGATRSPFSPTAFVTFPTGINDVIGNDNSIRTSRNPKAVFGNNNNNNGIRSNNNVISNNNGVISSSSSNFPPAPSSNYQPNQPVNGVTQSGFKPPSTLHYGFKPMTSPTVAPGFGQTQSVSATQGRFSAPNTLMFGFSPVATSGLQGTPAPRPAPVQGGNPAAGGYQGSPRFPRQSLGQPSVGNQLKPKPKSMMERITEFFTRPFRGLIGTTTA